VAILMMSPAGIKEINPFRTASNPAFKEFCAYMKRSTLFTMQALLIMRGPRHVTGSSPLFPSPFSYNSFVALPIYTTQRCQTCLPRPPPLMLNLRLLLDRVLAERRLSLGRLRTKLWSPSSRRKTTNQSVTSPMPRTGRNWSCA
jgi:hypothetical protein